MTTISKPAFPGLLALLLIVATACGGAAQDSAPAAGTPTEAATQHFPSDADVLAILQDRVDAGRSVGMVVGLLEADGSRRYTAAGEGGPDALPLTSKSVFEIGSITKVFTGTALAEMASRGEVGLDDTVAGFLPGNGVLPARRRRPDHVRP